MKKNRARQLILKKIHARNLITKKRKKFLRLENSPPPHNFSNGPSLNRMRNELTLVDHRVDMIQEQVIMRIVA